MPTNTLNGRTFDVDDEGFLARRDEWSEDLANDLGLLIGLDLLAIDELASGAPGRLTAEKKR